jgi:hypothetical protein
VVVEAGVREPVAAVAVAGDVAGLRRADDVEAVAAGAGVVVDRLDGGVAEGGWPVWAKQ